MGTRVPLEMPQGPAQGSWTFGGAPATLQGMFSEDERKSLHGEGLGLSSPPASTSPPVCMQWRSSTSSVTWKGLQPACCPLWDHQGHQVVLLALGNSSLQHTRTLNGMLK